MKGRHSNTARTFRVGLCAVGQCALQDVAGSQAARREPDLRTFQGSQVIAEKSVKHVSEACEGVINGKLYCPFKGTKTNLIGFTIGSFCYV